MIYRNVTLNVALLLEFVPIAFDKGDIALMIDEDHGAGPSAVCSL